MGTDGKLHAGIAFGKDIRLWLKSLFIPVAVGIIFYNSFLAVILLLPLCWVYVRIQKRELAKREDERLAGAFKDGIIAVSFSLNVGYSIENAFREAYKEKDHCPCQKACRYHGNCKECVAIHRAHQEHVPNCMRPVINKKIRLLSELTEHTIAREIEPPKEILRT